MEVIRENNFFVVVFFIAVALPEINYLALHARLHYFTKNSSFSPQW